MKWFKRKSALERRVERLEINMGMYRDAFKKHLDSHPAATKKKTKAKAKKK